jgi:protein-S-isoprenylcysteine O-methyltransferase Ste14
MIVAGSEQSGTTLRLFIRASIAFLALPVVVAGIVPLTIVGGNFQNVRTSYAIIPLVIGLILLLWCVRDFYVAGKGTLAPWDPPKHLVAVGLYRFVRNPMYLAVLTLVAGWALMFWSVWLLAYLIFLAVAFHLRVLFYEEPRLERNFGSEWKNYSGKVPRWLPNPRLIRSRSKV